MEVSLKKKHMHVPKFKDKEESFNSYVKVLSLLTWIVLIKDEVVFIEVRGDITKLFALNEASFSNPTNHKLLSLYSFSTLINDFSFTSSEEETTSPFIYLSSSFFFTTLLSNEE